MQVAAGIACLLLGIMHFVDRDRPRSETRSYYFGSILPRTAGVRGVLAVIEVVCGFALLFTA